MLKFLKMALAASVAALAMPAFAADMAVKATPAVPGYPYAASGFYFGLGASSEAGSTTVANTGIVALSAGLDGVVGFQWRGGLDFIALEADVTWTNLGQAANCTTGGGGTTSCSTNSKFEIEPLVKFGFPINTVLAVLPNWSAVFPGLPQLPSGVIATNIHPYIYGGLPIRDVSANFGAQAGRAWTVQGEAGIGSLAQWKDGLAVDVRAGCSIGTASFGFGLAQNAKMGLGCQSRLEFLY